MLLSRRETLQTCHSLLLPFSRGLWVLLLSMSTYFISFNISIVKVQFPNLIHGSYHRKIKRQIRKKINNFENFELPLLIEKGLMSFPSVTKFGNGVTKYSNTETHSSSSNNENCAQIKKPWAGFDPATFSLPRIGNILFGLLMISCINCLFSIPFCISKGNSTLRNFVNLLFDSKFNFILK